MQTRQLVNGVPVDQLVDTIREIRKQPEIAKFTFRTRNRWQDGGHNRAETAPYDGACQTFERQIEHVTDLDEPPVLLSGDKGANPVEALLAALSGCLTTSLVYHAAAMGIEVEEVSSTYEGDLDLHGFLGLDAGVRNGYEAIRVSFEVNAPGATEEQLDELVRVTRERSPVFDVVSNGTQVEVTRSR
jgi:uncharacterized OsmC-like protein